MNIRFAGELCDGDGICVHACPMHIVKLQQGPDRQFRVTLTDVEICVGCGSCVAACERDALTYAQYSEKQ